MIEYSDAGRRMTMPPPSPPFGFLRARIASCVLAAVCFAAPPALAAAQLTPEATEIAVTGYGEAVIAPGSPEIVLLLQGTGATAVEAYASVETSSKQLQSALAQKKARTALRGHHFTTAAREGAAVLTKNEAVRVERQLVVSTDQPADVPVLVDLALAQGASVIDVQYRPAGGGEVDAAVKQAAEAARRKAELVASSMGVKLGKVLSSVVTEEPTGESIRRAMREGGQLISNEERRTLVTVSVRYSIQQQ